MSTSFPAYESIFSFQPDSLLSSLSFNARKVFFFDLPTKEGSPRYVSCCFMTSAPKHCFMSSWMSGVALWLKNKQFCPDLFFSQMHAHMCPRIAQDGCIPPCVAWQKIMLSSAKKRCEIRGPCGQAATPWSEPIEVACWRRDESPSAQNKKRKGEMRSPCLKPLDGTMCPRGPPFNLID